MNLIPRIKCLQFSFLKIPLKAVELYCALKLILITTPSQDQETVHLHTVRSVRTCTARSGLGG